MMDDSLLLCEFDQYLDNDDLNDFFIICDEKIYLKKYFLIIKYLSLVFISISFIMILFSIYYRNLEQVLKYIFLIFIFLILISVSDIFKWIFKLLFRKKFNLDIQRSIKLFDTYILYEVDNKNYKLFIDDIDYIYKTKKVMLIKTRHKAILISIKSNSDSIKKLESHLENKIPQKIFEVNTE